MNAAAALLSLNRLGSGSAIAQRLVDIRCYGQRGWPRACPIARYVAAESGLSIDITHNDWWIVDGPYMRSDVQKTPEHVSEFIRRFDGGHFSELRADPS